MSTRGTGGRVYRASALLRVIGLVLIGGTGIALTASSLFDSSGKVLDALFGLCGVALFACAVVLFRAHVTIDGDRITGAGFRTRSVSRPQVVQVLTTPVRRNIVIKLRLVDGSLYTLPLAAVGTRKDMERLHEDILEWLHEQ